MKAGNQLKMYEMAKYNSICLQLARLAKYTGIGNLFMTAGILAARKWSAIVVTKY